MFWINFIAAAGVAFFICHFTVVVGSPDQNKVVITPFWEGEINESLGLDDLLIEFSDVEEISLKQSWLFAPKSDFKPTGVKVVWKPEELYIFAQLQDIDIISHSTDFNQRLWELGDVFETFIYFKEADVYYEFHVSPNNHLMQLRFGVDLTPDQRRLQLSGSYIVRPVVESSVWIEAARNRWYVLLRIPASTLKPSGFFAAGDTLEFSFSRYDHSHTNKEPVLSSSSDHKELDFHNREDWGILYLESRSD